MRCPLCKFDDEFTRFAEFHTDCRMPKIPGIDQHLIRHQCPECQVIFGPQQMLSMSVEELRKAYQALYAAGYEDGDPSAFELETFHMMDPSKNGTYINWGAGRSKVSRLARIQGYNLVDYDPFVDNSRNLINNKVDGIISNNLIEHFQNPIEELKTMSSMLKPGAYMIHATDCYQYRYEFTKFHLFFFIGSSLNTLAVRSGLNYQFITPTRVKFWKTA